MKIPLFKIFVRGRRKIWCDYLYIYIYIKRVLSSRLGGLGRGLLVLSFFFFFGWDIIMYHICFLSFFIFCVCVCKEKEKRRKKNCVQVQYIHAISCVLDRVDSVVSCRVMSAHRKAERTPI